MSHKPLTQEELEEEDRLLAEQAMRQAESDAFCEAMEEEHRSEMVEKEIDKLLSRENNLNVQRYLAPDLTEEH